MAFDVGSIEAHLELDRSQFNAELEAARRAGEDFENEKFTAELDVDDESFDREIDEAQRALDEIDGRRATAEFDADANPFHDEATAVRNASNAMNGQRSTTRFDGDDTDYQRGANRVRNSRSLLSGLPPVGIMFGAITNPFEIGASMVWGAIKRAGRARPTTTFDADTAPARRELGSLERSTVAATRGMQRLKNLMGQDATWLGRFGSVAALAARGADSLGAAVTRAAQGADRFNASGLRAAQSANRMAQDMARAGLAAGEVTRGLNAARAAADAASPGLNRNANATRLLASTSRVAASGMAALANALRTAMVPANNTSRSTQLLGSALRTVAPGARLAATGLTAVGTAMRAAMGPSTGLMNSSRLLGRGLRSEVSAGARFAGSALAALGSALTGTLIPSNALGTSFRTALASGATAAGRAIGILPGPTNNTNTAFGRLAATATGILRAGLSAAAEGFAHLLNMIPGVVISGTQVAAVFARMAPALAKAGLGIVSFAASLAVIIPLGIAVAAALGAILAAVVLLVASLSVVVVAVTAFVAGLALISAGAIMLVADLVQLRSAQNQVHDTQVALNEAYASGDSERITQAERAHAQAMNQLAIATEEAKAKGDEYYNALLTLNTAVDNFKAAATQAFTPVATKMAEIGAATLDVATNAMPQLGAAATASADAMVKGYTEAYDSSTTLQSVLDQIPGIIEAGTTATSNFGSAFSSFMDVALPYAQMFMDKVEEISAQLAAWADSEEGRAEIQAFLDAAVPVCEAFWDALVKVGGKLLEFAQEHGPAAVTAIELMAGAVEWLIGVLDTALGIAQALVDAITAGTSGPIGAGGSVPAGLATGGDVTGPTAMATGGDIAAMADGGDIGGAHFVAGPRRMDVNGQDVLYGEALSGSNREYAFPLDGGYRFITEEPGFDANSFALWADLGSRKGYFGDDAPSTRTDSNPVASGLSAAPAPTKPQLAPQLVIGGSGASRPGAASQRGVEERLESIERTLAPILREIRDETRAVAPGVSRHMNQSLAFGRATGAAVTKGLSRDAQIKAHEGTF